jgi:hypothetical protein
MSLTDGPDLPAQFQRTYETSASERPAESSSCALGVHVSAGQNHRL